MNQRKHILENYPNLADFLPFLDDLNAESERGVALIVSGYIEEQLRKIIAALLMEGLSSDKLLKGFNAPLRSFSSRAMAAEALGFISREEHFDLTIIRKIRNTFAHNHRTTFADQKIIDLCKELRYSAKDYGEVVVDARGQFTTASVALILGLTNRSHYVSKRRLKHESWPY